LDAAPRRGQHRVGAAIRWRPKLRSSRERAQRDQQRASRARQRAGSLRARGAARFRDLVRPAGETRRRAAAEPINHRRQALDVVGSPSDSTQRRSHEPRPAAELAPRGKRRSVPQKRRFTSMTAGDQDGSFRRHVPTPCTSATGRPRSSETVAHPNRGRSHPRRGHARAGHERGSQRASTGAGGQDRRRCSPLRTPRRQTRDRLAHAAQSAATRRCERDTAATSQWTGDGVDRRGTMAEDRAGAARPRFQHAGQRPRQPNPRHGSTTRSARRGRAARRRPHRALGSSLRPPAATALSAHAESACRRSTLMSKRSLLAPRLVDQR